VIFLPFAPMDDSPFTKRGLRHAGVCRKNAPMKFFLVFPPRHATGEVKERFWGERRQPLPLPLPSYAIGRWRQRSRNDQERRIRRRIPRKAGVRPPFPFV